MDELKLPEKEKGRKYANERIIGQLLSRTSLELPTGETEREEFLERLNCKNKAK